MSHTYHLFFSLLRFCYCKWFSLLLTSTLYTRSIQIHLKFIWDGFNINNKKWHFFDDNWNLWYFIDGNKMKNSFHNQYIISKWYWLPGEQAIVHLIEVSTQFKLNHLICYHNSFSVIIKMTKRKNQLKEERNGKLLFFLFSR